MWDGRRTGEVLFDRRGFPFGLVGIGTPTCRTEAVEVIPDVVPAEWTDLVTTGTGLEVSVVNVELLHTQRTRVVAVVAIEHSI
jgi:hypothetical protein